LKKGKYAFENTTVKREKSEIPTNKIIYLSGGINEQNSCDISVFTTHFDRGRF
jgi:hypothetical protein